MIDQPTLLANNIQRLLQAHLMSQYELSQFSNVPRATIHRLCSGKTTNPTAKTLQPIADYFGVSIEQLLGVHDLPSFTSH